MNGRATIKDVAERSGVSITTVSHVLNEVPGKRVSSATRARVLKSAEGLFYSPNRLARGLRTQRTQMIGFLSDRVSTTPFAGQMIVGAQDAAAEAGSLLVLLNSGGDPELEEREVQALQERQVDGIVYALFYHRVVIPPASLRNGPAVLLDARTPDNSMSSVVPDEVGGSRTAVEELLASGHRRIGFLNDSDDVSTRSLRLAGYRQALEVYGMPFNDSLVIERQANSSGGYSGAMELLTRSDRPTGIFCFNDRMAMGVYQTANAVGLAIPDDVSVVGFDDQELLSDSLGRTDHGRLPHYEMGQWAVRTLLKQIESQPPYELAHALIPCPIIRRGSVAAPPTAVRAATGQPNGFPDRPGGEPRTTLIGTADIGLAGSLEPASTHQRRGHPLQGQPLGLAYQTLFPMEELMKTRIIKRLAATMLVAVVPLPLTACAKGGSSASSSDEDSGGTKTISMWTHNAGNENELAAITEVVDDYNASQTNYKVEIQAFPQDSYNQSVVAAAAAKKLPCVLDIDGPNVPNWAWAGYLAPLEGMDDTLSKYLPSVLGKWNDKTYSYGFYDVALILFIAFQRSFINSIASSGVKG